MKKNSKIFFSWTLGYDRITLLLELKKRGFQNIHTIKSDKLDLKNQLMTNQYMLDIRPDYVFLIAARVGGIQANINSPAEFIYDNLMIQSNVINSSKVANVKKLLLWEVRVSIQDYLNSP